MAKKKTTECEEDLEDLGDLQFFENVPPLDADEAIAYINARAGASVIKRAEEASNPYLLRRPTGIASIDVEIFGGLPPGGITVIDGPDAVGKDALCALICSTSQTHYQNTSRIAYCCLEGGLDKQHLRNQGVVAPDSQEDLRFENARRLTEGLPELTQDEITRRTSRLGDFLVIDSGSGEDRLQAVLDLIAQNFCQIVVVDSISAATTQYRVDAPLSKEPKQAASAFMWTEFVKMGWYYFSNPLRGTKNLTTLILTNQVRANRNLPKGKAAQFAPKYVSNMPWAIKHAKLLDITLRPGERIPKKGYPQIGKQVNWRITKQKMGGHEGGYGEVPYYFATGFDRYLDLFRTANRYRLVSHKDKAKTCLVHDEAGEVLRDKVPWGEKGAGVSDAFYTDPDLYWGVYYACLRAAGASCLHTL